MKMCNGYDVSFLRFRRAVLAFPSLLGAMSVFGRGGKVSPRAIESISSRILLPPELNRALVTPGASCERFLTSATGVPAHLLHPFFDLMSKKMEADTNCSPGMYERLTDGPSAV